MAGQSSKSTTQIDLLCMLLNEDAEPKALTLPLLSEITNGFSDKMEIGSGGFAVVYKGVLENWAIAVKRLSNTYMYEKEFLREVECLMKVRHKNIVRFLGYCIDSQGNVASNNGEFIIAEVQQKLLCFEYLPKGSLSDYIQDASSGLDWRTRYQIIKGVCEGLHYLHELNIVHLDLKPANVLMDGQMRPKITDFGLSRCFKDDQTQWDTTKVGGTLGYLAPEFCSGKITYKFDLYSLGVMITEIITGKKGYQDVDYVHSIWSNRCRESEWKQIRVCTEIGLECSDFNPGKRPKSMTHILDRLLETESSHVISTFASEAAVSSDFLRVRPSALCFPLKKWGQSQCPLHLTSTTKEHVQFELEHTGTGTLVSWPHGGIVPPRCTYTLVLETRFIRDEQLEEMEIDDLVLRSSIRGVYHSSRKWWKHEVALKAFCTQPRKMVMSVSKRISPGIQVLSRYAYGSKIYKYGGASARFLDTDQAKQWIVVGEERGQVTIWDNRTQEQVHSMKVSRERVTCVKFIARKQWLVVGTATGYIHAYNCETKMQKITSFRATYGFLESLAVHPTQPYLLSSDHCGMKLWDWDKGFACIHDFEKEHSKEICQVAFNLNDTVASASEDHLVKVWSLSSAKSNYTLSGHTDKVNCLIFFTCDDKEYLVTGSNDLTAKIWDMQTKICIHTLVHTLEAFKSPVRSVIYEPNLHILITGSDAGYTYYWNRLNSYRLERVIDTGFGHGHVMGLAFFMGRVVIGREHAVVIMDIDHVKSYQEEYADDYKVPQLTGDTSSKVTPAASSIQHPLEICSLCEDDRWSLRLTNKTEEHVAFCLREKSGKCGFPPLIRPDKGFKSWREPYGIVPPRSTYILFLCLEDPVALEDTTDFELILQSSLSGDRYTFLFSDQDECHDFFSQAKDMGNTVYALSVKEGYTTSAEPIVKIIMSNRVNDYAMYSMDAHPTEPWIITGHDRGILCRWNYSLSIAKIRAWLHGEPEKLYRTGDSTCIYPGSVNYFSRKPVSAVKFDARKQWVLAGSADGVIHVYNWASGLLGEMEKITTFRAPGDYRVTSLAVHPTQPYVVLSKPPHNLEMEVWGWDKGSEFKQSSGADCDMLNPNSFVSAAHHGTELQVGSPGSPKTDHTLPGHSDSVNCLHYFTRGDRQYLITGSDDCTAKIWDLQKKVCIHTMAQEAIMSPVISVLSLLPHRPYLLTGSEHGTVQVWSSTDFRLEKTVNFGGGVPVRGLACLMGSSRVVVAQHNAISIMEIDQEA